MAAGGVNSIAAGLKRKMGDGDFTIVGEKVKVEGWQRKNLEGIMKALL